MNPCCRYATQGPEDQVSVGKDLCGTPTACEQLRALPPNPGLICCACPWILLAHVAVLGPAHPTPTLVFLLAVPIIAQSLTQEPQQDLTSTALLWTRAGTWCLLLPARIRAKTQYTLLQVRTGKWEVGGFQGKLRASVSLQKSLTLSPGSLGPPDQAY